MAWPWEIWKKTGTPGAQDGAAPPATARAATGRAGEAAALRYLEARGLRLLERNYRAGGGRSRRGGEIDLILREPDGTVVFVEVRARSGSTAGGAAASVSPAKRARVVFAAQDYLVRLDRMPPCRFDVVALDAGRVQWLRAAFDEGESV